MGYYMAPGRGDYYRGGRGDLLGFLKGAARTAVSFVTGGPVAAARTAVGQLAVRGGGGTAPAPMATRVSVQNPFGLGGFDVSRTPISAHASATEVRQALGIRRRRMNPANPKALRRALRRVEGFGALAARASADVARANRSLNRIPKKTTKKRR